MTPEAATPMNDLEAIVGRLLNRDILAAEPVASGGNNRVYRVTAEDGAYALKFYPPQEEDRRDRLGQEFAALKFMAANGIDCVPKPIAADKDLCCGIYEWMDGAPVNEPDGSDIDAMTAFAARLTELSGAPGTEELAPASLCILEVIPSTMVMVLVFPSVNEAPPVASTEMGEAVVTTIVLLEASQSRAE